MLRRGVGCNKPKARCTDALSERRNRCNTGGRPIAPYIAQLSQHAFVPHRPGDDPPLLGPERAPPASAASGFSIGPFRAEMGTSARPGHRARLSPHYRLEGVSVLGGSVGGTIGRGGGMITLQWRTSP